MGNWLTDSHPFRMCSAETSILEETNKIRLGCLLQSFGCRRLKAISFVIPISEVVRYFMKKPLKRAFTDEKIRGFLIATNLSEGDRS